MSDVWVLCEAENAPTGCGTILGVYTTLEAAEAALTAYRATCEEPYYMCLEIYTGPLDDPAPDRGFAPVL